MLRFTMFLAGFALVPNVSLSQEGVNSQRPDPFAEDSNPFAVASDDRPKTNKAERGFVDFAFDGGTLSCTFGNDAARRVEDSVMILHPNSKPSERAMEHFKIQPKDDYRGSIVVAVSKNAMKLIGKANVDAWAKERIADLASRDASVAEHAFVATVVHTVTAEVPLTMWSADAVDALNAGKWCSLFAKDAPKHEDASDK